MKQYTSKDQTAKLMELGFSFPKRVIGVRNVLGLEDGKYKIDFENAYSIGELIGFLCNPVIEYLAEVWKIEYDGSKGKQFIEEDLIDALYNACIYFKKSTI